MFLTSVIYWYRSNREYLHNYLEKEFISYLYKCSCLSISDNRGIEVNVIDKLLDIFFYLDFNKVTDYEFNIVYKIYVNNQIKKFLNL